MRIFLLVRVVRRAVAGEGDSGRVLCECLSGPRSAAGREARDAAGEEAPSGGLGPRSLSQPRADYRGRAPRMSVTEVFQFLADCAAVRRRGLRQIA